MVIAQDAPGSSRELESPTDGQDDVEDEHPGEESITPQDQASEIASLRKQVNQLLEGYVTLQRQVSNRSPSEDPEYHARPREPKVSDPPEFSGKVSEFANFLAHCNLVFTLQRRTYLSNESRVLYIISWLRGGAADWARPVLVNAKHPHRHDYPAFRNALTAVYQDRTTKLSAADKLGKLKQTKSAAAYAAEFQSLCAILGLDPQTQITHFYNGLNPDLKHALAISGQPEEFQALLDKVISIDQSTFLIEKEKAKDKAPKSTSSAPHPGKFSSGKPSNPRPSTSQTPSAPSSSGPRPRLTPEEKNRRRENGLCDYCGEFGHFKKDCPTRPAPKASPAPAPAYAAVVRPIPTPPEN
jgi:hypothetical protein